jgi:hypothetical protein
MFDTLIHFGIKHNHCNVPLDHIEEYPGSANESLDNETLPNETLGNETFDEINSSAAIPISESDNAVTTNPSTSENPLKENISLMNELRSGISNGNTLGTFVKHLY